MKATLSYSLLIVFLFALILSCQKEINWDIDKQSKGNIAKDINGNCMPVIMGGVYGRSIYLVLCKKYRAYLFYKNCKQFFTNGNADKELAGLLTFNKNESTIRNYLKCRRYGCFITISQNIIPLVS